MAIKVIPPINNRIAEIIYAGIIAIAGEPGDNFIGVGSWKNNPINVIAVNPRIKRSTGFFCFTLFLFAISCFLCLGVYKDFCGCLISCFNHFRMINLSCI